MTTTIRLCLPGRPIRLYTVIKNRCIILFWQPDFRSLTQLISPDAGYSFIKRGEMAIFLNTNSARDYMIKLIFPRMFHCPIFRETKNLHCLVRLNNGKKSIGGETVWSLLPP